MTTVFDVAEYILQKCCEMTAMKLQKLCYYSQAWHLVWEETSLFPEPIQAWANGPVVRALYAAHRGEFRVSSMPSWTDADPGRLQEHETTTIDAVLDFYAPMSGHELSELTHAERPWKSAREGIPAGVRSEVRITDDQMAAYYDSLTVNATQS